VAGGLCIHTSEILETIKLALHDRDKLFVARLQRNWAKWALGDERNNWLKGRAF
jgi:hypothetical protein